MKKLLLAVASAALLFASCGTTSSVKGSGVKGKAAKVSTAKKIMVDYQGSVLGKEVPAWVERLVEGQYSQEALKPVMPNVEGKKIWVISERGEKLDFAKAWATQYGIETRVSAEFERVVGRVGQQTMEGKEKEEKQAVSKAMDDMRVAMQTTRIQGLGMLAEYWVEIAEPETEKKYFEYYAVYGMDEKVYEEQFKSAMKNVDLTTALTKELEETTLAKLKQHMDVSSNEPEVQKSISASDEFVVYAN